MKTGYMLKAASLALVASLALGGGLTSFSATAAKKEKSAVEEKHKKRKTYIMSERVGKKVQKAFEAYSADDIPGAIEILSNIKAKKDFDKAYVARFLGNLYATQEGKIPTAIKQLEAAIAPDILNASEHAQSLRLIADLYMQEKQYTKALEGYKAWMDFTGEEDVQVYLRIAQSRYELKQYAEMIAPADKAIAISKKPEKNAYVLKLSSYYERKDFKGSVSVLETLVTLFPEDKRWWSQLGMFYMLIDDYEKALATMDLAYKQGYLEKETEIKALAQLYATNNVPFKSAQIQEKYLETGLIERDVRAVSMLANTWHSAKEIAKAAKYYEEAANMSQDPDLYRKLGNLLLQDEAYSKAAVAFEKSLELGVSRKGRVHMSLAEAYLYQDKYRKAYQSVKAAQEDPKTKKSAKSWAAYIKDKAGRNGVRI